MPFNLNFQTDSQMEPKKKTLNVVKAGIKAKSKQEIYRVVTSEAGIFLPPKHDAPIDFIREVCLGTKK